MGYLTLQLKIQSFYWGSAPHKCLFEAFVQILLNLSVLLILNRYLRVVLVLPFTLTLTYALAKQVTRLAFLRPSLLLPLPYLSWTTRNRSSAGSVLLIVVDCLTMATLRKEVLVLYKSLLREGSKFSNYNFRSVLFNVKDATMIFIA